MTLGAEPARALHIPRLMVAEDDIDMAYVLEFLLSREGLSAGTAVATGVACGVFGALVKAISNHGLDNFTIQVAASAAAFVLLA